MSYQMYKNAWRASIYRRLSWLKSKLAKTSQHVHRGFTPVRIRELIAQAEADLRSL